MTRSISVVRGTVCSDCANDPPQLMANCLLEVSYGRGKSTTSHAASKLLHIVISYGSIPAYRGPM